MKAGISVFTRVSCLLLLLVVLLLWQPNLLVTDVVVAQYSQSALNPLTPTVATWV